MLREEQTGMEWMQGWKERQDKSIRVVAFGSSNTELTWSNEGRHNWVNWLSLSLREHIGKHVQVINQGISGETTEQLLLRLERDVISYQPQLVIITIGGNDAIREMKPGDYAQRLQEICEKIMSAGGLPMLQTYYCPMYHMGRPGFEQRFEAMMQVNRDLTDELKLPLVDQYSHFEPLYRDLPDAYAAIMRDWIHVNHIGNLMMGQLISRRLGLPPLPVPEDVKLEGVVPENWLA
jgi:lysophospholipase L1-like esterase